MDDLTLLATFTKRQRLMLWDADLNMFKEKVFYVYNSARLYELAGEKKQREKDARKQRQAEAKQQRQKTRSKAMKATGKTRPLHQKVKSMKAAKA